MTNSRPPRVRLRQAGIVGAGLVVALVMVLLGLWQMDRSMQTGEQAILDRASQEAVPLFEHVRPDNTFDDIYGRQVTVSGRYLADQTVLVVAPDGTIRVLTALLVADGRVVPVVRGVASGRDAVPRPPTGTATASGIFLPGEAGSATDAMAGDLGTVRLPLLAQRWAQRLTPGFVTVDAAGAAAQGLREASVTLPQGEKSLQNGSYAVQWWIFAATALAIALMLAKSVGDRARRAADATPDGDAGSVTRARP